MNSKFRHENSPEIPVYTPEPLDLFRDVPGCMKKLKELGAHKIGLRLRVKAHPSWKQPQYFKDK